MTAATNLANLETRKASICTELAAMAATKAGGLPNSSGAIGKNVDHVGYRLSLLAELKELNAAINELEDIVDYETYGDYEGTVRGVT